MNTYTRRSAFGCISAPGAVTPTHTHHRHAHIRAYTHTITTTTTTKTTTIPVMPGNNNYINNKNKNNLLPVTHQVAYRYHMCGVFVFAMDVKP